MHLLEQGQDSQPMESQFHLGYRHTDKNVAGTRVKTLLSYPKLRESIPPGQEHPSRAGTSRQGRSIPPGQEHPSRALLHYAVSTGEETCFSFLSPTDS